MKLDFLDTASDGCPLIRLFDFTSQQASALKDAVSGLAAGGPAVAIHELPFVQPIHHCRFTLHVSNRDKGIIRIAHDESNIRCSLTIQTWDNMTGLIEPFITGSDGYQWLTGRPEDGGWLLSNTGRW